jgi:hypothetical protein
MVADDQKKSRDVRRGALLIATAATFLLISGCDSGRDWEEADGSGPSGHVGRSGGYTPGARPVSGIQADPQTGTVRGGFGKTGSFHASAS